MAESKSESSELKDGEKVELRGAITSKPSDDEPAEKPEKPEKSVKSTEKPAKIVSKPVDVSALEAAPAARPNISSITSAAPVKRDLSKLYLIVGLVICAGLTAFLGVLLATKSSEVATLERELNDEKAYVLELKERLNAAGY